MARQHTWALVGPWYRTESAGGGVPERSQRPIFQKYAASDFVSKFLDEPQTSLKFVCEDFANKLCLDPNLAVEPGAGVQENDDLKLFLDAHSRFYIVVCELHCVAPGFPSVEREQVCEAGFVIRKRVTRFPAVARASITQAVAMKRRLAAELLRQTEAQRKARQITIKAQKTPKDVVIQTLAEARGKKIDRLQSQLQEADENLQRLGATLEVSQALKGWVPGEHSGFGSWSDVEETPQEIEEEILPLYPLIPDAGKHNHTAKGKSLWFGVVPTQSADVDTDGNARYDDDSLYEIRCFVRRHKPPCEKKSTRRDCPGEIVWSIATESYKIAPFFDLDGAGHKPINIKLPDLAAVKEQAMRGPIGKGNNIRMIAPEDSVLGFKSDGLEMPTGGDSSGNQICFFSIILITIVALFVLRLFLPIVVFIFQLWFLLRLKLCILPSLEMDAGLAADLDVHGPEFTASIEANFAADFKLGGQAVTNFSDLRAVFENPALFDASGSMDKNLKDDILQRMQSLDMTDASDPERANVDGFIQGAIDSSTDFSDNPDPNRKPGVLPDVTDGLIYFDVEVRV